MPKLKVEAALLRPSVFDRLMGPRGVTAPRGQLGGIGLRELYAVVCRDLEWLLNSKRWFPEPLADLPEASESILTYGLPDLSTYSWRNSADATGIARMIEDVIRRFEPRLWARTVQVTPLPRGEVDDFSLHFRIDAVLQVEPIRAPVSFDTDVDFDASRITVRGQS